MRREHLIDIRLREELPSHDYGGDPACVADVCQGVGVQHQQVGPFANVDCSLQILSPQKSRWIDRRRLNGLKG